MTKVFLGGLLLTIASLASAGNIEPKEYLVKLKPGARNSISAMANLRQAGKVEALTDAWVKVTDAKGSLNMETFQQDNIWVEYIQPNYRIHLIENYAAKDLAVRNWAAQQVQVAGDAPRIDNPAIPSAPQRSAGEDPLFTKQWGMIDNHVKDAWKMAPPSPLAAKDMIVAVIDTGVDYTHEDLLPNMWRNPGETGVDANGKSKDSNGIDDDNNGFIDDVVGWDFAMNDNKPFDLSVDPMQLLAGGGNPGHGTHCAGNVAAAADNGKGVVGVAPNVKIMALRFLTEKGSGTTADAIKAVKYAVDNGAMITSNSWGSEGEDPSEAKENKALRDMVQYAQDKGTLFIAAAGNGHQGKGYNNDTDAKPGYPASYDHDAIISVAAIDDKDQLGSFSNWGQRSVDLGAPGVKIFSTTVGSNYADTIFDKFGITVHWDGTSMATPHVSGAAALYWSAHPEKDWQQVKAAILGSVKQTSTLNGKTSSGGKLDVLNLMKQSI
jgi:subtilisin family serine protease